ncbi:hypothetical protein [Aliiroseovarius sediminis]|nr:hypothetical protein [Aliiroseovarius sediminis]
MDRKYLDDGTQGLSVLVDLSWDKLLFAGGIVAALGISAALASLI